jgi:hypothetical protein
LGLAAAACVHSAAHRLAEWPRSPARGPTRPAQECAGPMTVSGRVWSELVGPDRRQKIQPAVRRVGIGGDRALHARYPSIGHGLLSGWRRPVLLRAFGRGRTPVTATMRRREPASATAPAYGTAKTSFSHRGENQWWIVGSSCARRSSRRELQRPVPHRTVPPRRLSRPLRRRDDRCTRRSCCSMVPRSRISSHLWRCSGSPRPGVRLSEPVW